MNNIKKDYKKIEQAFKRHAQAVVFVDEIPVGFYNIKQIKKIMKLGDRATRRKLSLLVEKNVVERKHFMTITNDANLPRKTAYFKFHDKPQAHSASKRSTNKRPL